MKQLLEVPLSDNSAEDVVTVFEISPWQAGSELELAADEGGPVVRARVSLEQALGQLRPALSKVMNTVKELAPSEAEVEFGLKVTAESGIVT